MGRWEVLPNKFPWKHAYMSCHACMEPALPWRACFHAWGRMGVCRDFASCQAFPIQLMYECAEHMPEGRSSSGCGIGFMQSLAGRLVRKGVAVSFLSVSVHCSTRTLRLNWLYPGEFQTLPPSFHRKAFVMTGYFSPLQISCPTEKSPKFLFQKTFKLDSVLQRASCGEKPSDTRSILTEKEKNHHPTAIWMLQFSLVVNFYLSSMNLESFV